MAKRSYDQSCGLATALDVLGERWALLILRDLVLGPQRYTDLLEGLGGIGTNLLANRLRELEALGLVRKRELPPPAASTVYELSEEGRELEPAMAALGRWGARYVTLPESAESFPPRFLLIGLVMSLTPEHARALEGRRYELRVGGLPVPAVVRARAAARAPGAGGTPRRGDRGAGRGAAGRGGEAAHARRGARRGHDHRGGRARGGRARCSRRST